MLTVWRVIVTAAAACTAAMSLSSAASAQPPGAWRAEAGADASAQCPKAPYGPNFYAPGPVQKKTVALTFDDGPGRSTGRILGILRSFKVPATFFNIGENEAVRKYLVRDEANDKFVLGNHTWDHPDMVKLSAKAQAAELDRTSVEQKSITGTVPCVFRPPYGNYDKTLLKLAQQRGLRVWLWSVDTQDWMADGSGSPYWVKRIIRLAEQEGGVLEHPVVLMHNQPIGNPATVSALPTIIRYFRSHGYRFVSL